MMGKLTILADAAKYDAACTSSGNNRAAKAGQLGNAISGGICHSFTADGRCVSLLKVLLTNVCIYDCQYCVNRVSNDVPRSAFTPQEIADLTIQFYRRNYIEGLFLSSAVVGSPDHTMELLIRSVSILRNEYKFNGYIHCKCIPGADPLLIDRLGVIVDRISVNVELPSEQSLGLLAPDKAKQSIFKPMGYIANRLLDNKTDAVALRHGHKFAPAGHATQMVIGATPDTDLQIIRLSETMYRRYKLKRVFFSAYSPIGTHPALPKTGPAPLLREHRLYQADWLVRFYDFAANEILDENQPNFNVYFDPKCDWALRHMDQFPVEVMRADRETLLRVPGIGLTSVERILSTRRQSALTFEGLKRMGVVLKRAKFFITCQGKTFAKFPMTPSFIAENLLIDHRLRPEVKNAEATQLSLWDGMPDQKLLKNVGGASLQAPSWAEGWQAPKLADMPGGASWMTEVGQASQALGGALPLPLPTLQDVYQSNSGQL